MRSIRTLVAPVRGPVRWLGDRLPTGPVAGALRAARHAPVVSMITPAGWCVLLAAVAALAVGSAAQWAEAGMAGTALLVVIALCALFTIGRMNVGIDLTVTDRRIRAGTFTTVHVRLTNRARGPLLALALRIPVGPVNETYRVPGLGAAASETFDLRVDGVKRSVIRVGPVTTVRGDPFGLLARTVRWTDVTEVFVLPDVIELDPIGAGLRHDLEGRTGTQLSSSDLAFHALRDYVPGDDSRFIHWRSSAKVSTTMPGGRFLVRQFLETRRTHVLVVVDGDPAGYRDPDEFEVAISAGASLALQAVRDQLEASILVAGQVATGANRAEILETCARAVPTGTPLPTLVSRALRAAPQATALFLISGSVPDVPSLRKAAGRAPYGMATTVVQVDPRDRPAARTVGSMGLVTIRALRDLRAVLSQGGGV